MDWPGILPHPVSPDCPLIVVSVFKAAVNVHFNENSPIYKYEACTTETGLRVPKVSFAEVRSS